MSVLFPKWLNMLPTMGAFAAVGGLVAASAGGWYYLTPDFFEVGYMPRQPGSGFNHQLHAGELGIDCRYCHTHVERSPEANIPNVATCFGCHKEGQLAADVEDRIGAKVGFIRVAYENDESIPWRRVHKLPDYVRNFPHNVHVKAGVSCLSCHGSIISMPIVYQHEGLGMGWCFDCHRDIEGDSSHPEKHLVPHQHVTHLKWIEKTGWFENPGEHKAIAEQIASEIQTRPPDNCGACHY